MDEFPYEKRTRLRETDEHHGVEFEDHETHSQQNYSSIEGCQNKEGSSLMSQMQILGSHGKQSVKIKIKHNDSLPGPKV